MSFSILLVAVTMFIIWATPKITKIIPGPLTAIIIISAFVIYFDVGVPLVGDLASISGGLPQFHMPIVPFEIETLLIIGPYAIILATIGLIESLLTLNLVGEITGKRGGASKECIAQGAANTGAQGATGSTGAQGGLSTYSVPSGGIIIWSGAANAIPSGWVLCNGSNSTPDLRGKFVVGYSNTDNDFDVGDTGGYKDSIVVSHSHDHNLSGSTNNTGNHSHSVLSLIHISEPTRPY